MKLPAATEVYFFHLQNRALEAVLPKLLLKTLQREWRACVWTADEERLGQISEAMWAVPHEWILPHGFADEPYPEQHPIWLSSCLACPNSPEAIFLCQGLWSTEDLSFPDNLQRLCLMIEPMDRESTEKARTLWRECAADKRTLVKV